MNTVIGIIGAVLTLCICYLVIRYCETKCVKRGTKGKKGENAFEKQKRVEEVHEPVCEKKGEDPETEETGEAKK